MKTCQSLSRLLFCANQLGKFVAVGLLLLPAWAANADNLLVPDDYGTIQEAVDAANSGDTILIATDTDAYAEDVNIRKSGLTLQAETLGNCGKVDDLYCNVTIQGQGGPFGPRFLIAGASQVAVRGINFAAGTAFTVEQGGSAWLIRSRISGAQVTVNESSSLRIQQSTLVAPTSPDDQALVSAGGSHVFLLGRPLSGLTQSRALQILPQQTPTPFLWCGVRS